VSDSDVAMLNIHLIDGMDWEASAAVLKALHPYDSVPIARAQVVVIVDNPGALLSDDRMREVIATVGGAPESAVTVLVCAGKHNPPFTKEATSKTAKDVAGMRDVYPVRAETPEDIDSEMSGLALVLRVKVSANVMYTRMAIIL
jgi:hypothetical protein